MPKGVMWEQGVLWKLIGKDPSAMFEPAPETLEALDLSSQGSGNKALAILPFMHGAGVWSSLSALAHGGTVVIMRTRTFNPELAIDCIEKHGIWQVTIAGDAFARPLIDAMESRSEGFELAGLGLVLSSAMVLSTRNKRALLRHCPNLAVVDMVGSSESTAAAISIATAETELDGD